MPVLSVIIPVYNEARTIDEILHKVLRVDLDKEIIIVDDGSSDGTRDLLGKITDKNIKIIYLKKNSGKGSALSKGIAAAAGQFVIAQDADLEYEPQDYLLLVNYALANNLEVVYGSRFLETRKNTPLWHYLVNKALTGLTNIMFGSRLTDMETCYKLIKLDLIKRLNLNSKRFEVEPEITAKLLKRGYKIREIPIRYKSRFYHQGKKIGWRDGVSCLFYLLRLRFLSAE